MVLAEHPKLEFAASYGFNGSEEKIGSQKVSVTNHANGFEYTATSDSFVIDMDSFSNAINQETGTNSRITLQRNLSRKGCQRSNGDVDLSTPKVGGAVGSAMPEKPAGVAVGAPQDHSSSAQVHHQIIVSTTNNNINLRRNSFKRSSTSCLFDPKRILFFFATLSSLGTIILIYFTLSVAKYNPGENGLA